MQSAGAGGSQDLDHLCVLPVPRMRERRLAVPVGEIDIGARIYEQPDDLRVAWAAVAEDDCLEQCRPAEVVDVVDVDVGLEQLADDFDCPRSAARISPVPLKLSRLVTSAPCSSVSRGAPRSPRMSR